MQLKRLYMGDPGSGRVAYTASLRTAVRTIDVTVTDTFRVDRVRVQVNSTSQTSPVPNVLFEARETTQTVAPTRLWDSFTVSWRGLCVLEPGEFLYVSSDYSSGCTVVINGVEGI